MHNPVKQRIEAERLKRVAETLVGSKNFSWHALFYLLLVFLVSSWLPDGIVDLTKAAIVSGKPELVEGLLKVVVSVIIVLFMGIQLKKAMQKSGQVEVLGLKPPSNMKILGIFLSPIGKTSIDVIERAVRDGHFSGDMLAGTPWEMALKAVDYCRELEMLLVITSSGKDGTCTQMPLFGQIINLLRPDIEVKELVEGGINFEDVPAVFKATEEIYEIAAVRGVPGEAVIVDVTGGQKTNSIAAAIATLSVGRKFQYVSTRDKEVRAYDVTYIGED